jgi:hypothetical protein
VTARFAFVGRCRPLFNLDFAIIEYSLQDG